MRLLTSLLILSCLLLGACGQKGPLVPPPPQAAGVSAASVELAAATDTISIEVCLLSLAGWTGLHGVISNWPMVAQP